MVQILYLDESADQGWFAPHGTSKWQRFILGGAIMNPQAAKALAAILMRHWQVMRAERKAIAGPEQFPLPFPNLPYFHLTDMLAGKKEPWIHFDNARRRRFIEEILDDMLTLEIRFVGDVLDKQAHRTRWGGNAWAPFEFLIANCLGRFQRDLSAANDVGLCVMDSQGSGREASLRRDYERFITRGTTLSENPRFPPHKLDNVIDVVMFSPSKYAAGLQAADFAAGMLFQKFERGDPSFYERTKKAWKRPRTGYDPSVLP